MLLFFFNPEPLSSHIQHMSSPKGFQFYFSEHDPHGATYAIDFNQKALRDAFQERNLALPAGELRDQQDSLQKILNDEVFLRTLNFRLEATRYFLRNIPETSKNRKKITTLTWIKEHIPDIHKTYKLETVLKELLLVVEESLVERLEIENKKVSDEHRKSHNERSQRMASHNTDVEDTPQHDVPSLKVLLTTIKKMNQSELQDVAKTFDLKVRGKIPDLKKNIRKKIKTMIRELQQDSLVSSVDVMESLDEPPPAAQHSSVAAASQHSDDEDADENEDQDQDQIMFAGKVVSCDDDGKATHFITCYYF